METIIMDDDWEKETAIAPPGFRFFPTEEELVSFYLPNKLLGTNLDLLIHRIIPVLDIYHFNPWDLPQNAGVDCRDEQEQWFFFVPRQESEARGGKPNRLTTTGYWKATGSPGTVYSRNNVRAIGVKRSMVFYEGRAPEGKKTEWKMNEYKAFAALDPKQIRQEFSLCRVYKKSKCLRAFDRRPLAPSQVILTRDDHDDMQRTAQKAQYHIGASPSSSIINPTINSVDEIGSSSSREHHIHHGLDDEPAVEETNILDMDVDYNNLLDWDCLQWD